MASFLLSCGDSCCTNRRKGIYISSVPIASMPSAACSSMLEKIFTTLVSLAFATCVSDITCSFHFLASSYFGFDAGMDSKQIEVELFALIDPVLAPAFERHGMDVRFLIWLEASIIELTH